MRANIANTFREKHLTHGDHYTIMSDSETQLMRTYEFMADDTPP